ncbi:MAG: helix-turn-helix domain-containing protein [Polyangiaceae bacterium]
MKGYGQFCSVAQALEVFGERWTLLLIRELLEGSTRFSELQRGVPLMSRSVLAQRLQMLCDNGVVAHSDGEYRLTAAGKELAPIVMACGTWGARWARRKLKSADVDVGLLMWDIRRRIELEAIPDKPVLVAIEFRGAKRGQERFFLHFKGDAVELCLTNPGYEVQMRVSTTPRALAEVWLGDVPFASAVRAGDIRLEGPRALLTAFPGWLQLSRFAETPRPSLAG